MDVPAVGTLLLGRWRVLSVARVGEGAARLDALTVADGVRVSIVRARVPKESSAHVAGLARLWTGLRVDGLAPILEVRLDGDFLVVVSAQVDGVTLASQLAISGQRLDEPALLALAGRLCDVLERMHTAGVVSGAVAPDTVVSTDTTWLLELDAVRALRSLQRSRSTDASIDVHGLGRVLYFAGTGLTPPDLRDGVGDTGAIAPMHTLNDTVSAHTERAVTQMLRTDPARRPRDVATARALLGLPGATVAAPPPPESSSAPPPPEASPAPPPLVVPQVQASMPPTGQTLGVALPEAVRGSRSTARRVRPVSFGGAAMVLAAFCLFSVAWIARLLYVVTDDVRVRVDPRYRPAPPRPRMRVAAPRSPYPATLMGTDGAVMMRVSEGAFPRGVPDPDRDDGPQLSDTLAPFYIDRTEVTVAQFAHFVEATGWVAHGPWRQYVRPDALDLPVAGVTAEDAEEYARWLGKRLPTEEQWEKAARGSQGRTWPWGDRPPDPAAAALYAVTSDSGGAMLAVGSCPQGASPFGALDMCGNVWEWTMSAYAPYSGSRSEEPLFDSGLRVIRGGSWNAPMALARTTTRMPMPPRLWAPDVGFRCVLTLR